jgi:hypothetical protein
MHQPTHTAPPDGLVEGLLQEFVTSAPATIGRDPSAGVLRGVKLLGLRSRNGRVYREGALRGAMPLYEGAKVYVNHPAGDPLGPRDYRDRLGVVRNVRLVAGEGLFGDLHYNPRHPLAEQLAWDAEHAPRNVGLSHNVVARTRSAAEGLVVEEITGVRSVDLVADPATTAGLFEHDAANAAVATESFACEPPAHGAPAPVTLDRSDDARRRVESLFRERRLAVDGERPIDALVEALAGAPSALVEEAVAGVALLARRASTSARPLAESRESRPLGPGPASPRTTHEFVEAITKRRV